MKSFATNAVRQLPSFLDIQFDPQFVVGKFDRNNTMVLDSQSEKYDTGYEHESFIRYLGFSSNFLTNGFDSCFLL